MPIPIVPFMCGECGCEFVPPHGGLCATCGTWLCEVHVRRVRRGPELVAACSQHTPAIEGDGVAAAPFVVPDPRALKAQITAAFAGAVYPGEDAISRGMAHDQEVLDLADLLRGRRWQDVTPELLGKARDAVPLLPPAAYAYYLPAYLTACVDAPVEMDVSLPSVVWSLSPRRSNRWWFEPREPLFTREHAACFVGFLAWAKHHGYAGDGNDRDWSPAMAFWAARAGARVG